MNININPKIFTASGEELASFALFHDMIKVMKAADGIEPAGACCGRNTKQIINLFLNSKQKYVDFMKNISVLMGMSSNTTDKEKEQFVQQEQRKAARAEIPQGRSVLNVARNKVA